MHIQICLSICPTQQQFRQVWQAATLSCDWSVETNDSELYRKWLDKINLSSRVEESL